MIYIYINNDDEMKLLCCIMESTKDSYEKISTMYICARNTDFIEHIKELTTHLLNRAYPIKVVTKQWNKVTKINQSIKFISR